MRRVVTREDVKAYAAVSGDDNPLHLDDAFALAVGFDGIIAHGMFTMGHMAAAVTSWTGDPGSILRLTASFREPVAMGEELVAGGRVKALDPEARTATLETWVAVERDGHRKWPIKRGEAVVKLG
jgi:acyl dehydratase